MKVVMNNSMLLRSREVIVKEVNWCKEKILTINS